MVTRMDEREFWATCRPGDFVGPPEQMNRVLKDMLAANIGKKMLEEGLITVEMKGAEMRASYTHREHPKIHTPEES